MKLVPENWINDFNLDGGESSKDTVLPTHIGKTATAVWKRMRNVITLTDDQRVVYADQTIGSHVGELFDYFMLPQSKARERPFDSDRFFQLMLNSGIRATEVDARFARFIADSTESINMTGPSSPSTPTPASTLPKWRSY
jgi:hypothetical protein